MSLQGMPPGQKIPGALAMEIREYAAALDLPKGWENQITLRYETLVHVPGGIRWFVDYKGQPLATYDLDALHEISDARRYAAISPPVDPLVVASQLAVSQPADPEWRRFKHLTFRREEVISVNNVDEKGRENEGTFVIMFKNGQQLIVGNEKNYANTGMSTFEFFLQHVMILGPEHANRVDHR